LPIHAPVQGHLKVAVDPSADRMHRQIGIECPWKLERDVAAHALERKVPRAGERLHLHDDVATHRMRAQRVRSDTIGLHITAHGVQSNVTLRASHAHIAAHRVGADLKIGRQLDVEVDARASPALSIPLAVIAAVVAPVVPTFPHDTHDDAIGRFLHFGRDVGEVAARAALRPHDLNLAAR
jgi:hypothetical protein